MCVWESQISYCTTGFTFSQSAGGAGGTQEISRTNKDARQLHVKQWRTLHCVPAIWAICDIIYSTSCALFLHFIVVVYGASECESECEHRSKV